MTGSGTDVMWVCLFKTTYLCRLCSSVVDCISFIGAEDVCVFYGSQGNFCGVGCE